MNEQQFENLMEEMADYTAETLSKEQEDKERAKLSESITRISAMLRGKDFTRKCKEQADKYGVNEKFIKNTYAKTILNGIANTTGIVLEIVGEAFNYLVRLISYVLQKIMDIAVSALTKLVNFITLRVPASA